MARVGIQLHANDKFGSLGLIRRGKDRRGGRKNAAANVPQERIRANNHEEIKKRRDFSGRMKKNRRLKTGKTPLQDRFTT
jgi:hypothetical protein